MKTKRKNNKQGISLIVLVITIIVMIILAAAIILSLSSNGIINRANEAVEQTDEKQMQALAATLWAEAYLDYSEGKITEDELIQRVEAGLLEMDKNYKTKYNVEISKNGVDVKLPRWETVFDGSVTTEGGMALLANEWLFNLTDIYRITLESDAIEGELVTRIVYTGNNSIYIAGYIKDGKTIGILSMEQAQKESTSLETPYTAVGIQQGVFDGVKQCFMMMVIQGETESYEYTIKKIEKMTEPRGWKKVYTGNGNAVTGEFEIKGLSIKRDYVIECEINGELMLLESMGMANLDWPATMFGLYGENKYIFIANDIFYAPLGEVIIHAIYDIGPSKYSVTENGFTVTNEGKLIGTPEGEYVIPEKVGDITVSTIAKEALKGTAIISRYVTITSNDVPKDLEKIVIKKEAEAIIKDFVNVLSYEVPIIDVTDCGDNVDLPEEYLTTQEDITNMLKIYVTSNAKENHYKEYTNVIGVE